MMTLDDFDLPTMERRAFISGQREIADLIGAFDDAVSDHASILEENERELEEAKTEAREAEEALRELTRNVREKLETVDRIIAECKRISNRADLESALQDVYNEVSN